MNIGIITGASSGMGKYFAIYALQFFPDLDELWLVGRNMNRLVQTSRKIHIKTRIFAIDLANENELMLLKNTVINENPDIKLLVNCAGLGYIGRFDDMSSDDNLNMIDVNVRALTQILSISIDYMIPGSHIINLASAAAFIPQPEFAVYAATKSYVLSLSTALNRELKKKRIYVTAVCPGCVNTPFFDVAEKYNKIKKFKKIFMAKDKNVVKKALWDARKRKSISVYGNSMNIFRILCKILPEKIILMFI